MPSLPLVGGALALAAAAAAQCVEPVRGGRPPLAEGCLVVYVDVGTNIGVQLRKFFQPEHYPGSKVMPVFARSFPTDENVRRGSRPCAFGFEANPTHTARLRQLEAAYNAAGHRLSIATETAVGTAEGNTTFFFTGSRMTDMAASTMQNVWLRRGGKRVLQATVRTIDLAHWLRAEVFARSEAARPGAVVIMKLDIEGSEASVLPWLAQCGALCGLGPTMIEEHARLAEDKAAYLRAVGPFIRAASTRSLQALAGVMRAAPGERCTFEPLLVDDEFYLLDNGATGKINLDRAFGISRITQRAPFPKPLPLSAGGRAEGPAAPWPDWAAIAWRAKEPLSIEEVYVAPPKAGEVRVRVIANALCHTDTYTLDGHDPEGLFPCILGHEAGAVVIDVGEGVTSLVPGDHVIPCYTPECREPSCIFCASPKTNLCPKIRSTQGKGLMPDGTSRFTSVRTGEKLYHFMGCSTFSEVTVLSEISCAKIDKDAPLAQVCLLGCGVSTGWGAVWNTCKVEAGSSVAVFGLGAVGLAVVQAAKIAGARAIYAIDTNASKFEAARALGATDCIDPSGLPDGQTATQALVAKTTWGVDFTFDCTGNTGVMRGALEAAHRGWGVSCVIGVAASGHEIATRPFQLVTGRTWKGTAFGGWKSRTHVPQLVARVQRGELSVEPFISLTLDGIEATGEAVKALHSGAILRAVVRYAPDPAPAPGGAPVPARGLRLVSSVSLHGGRQLRFVHPSAACGCEMTFSLYLPPQHASAGPGGSREPSVPIPTIVWLSGLTCTDENAVQKGGFQALAAARGMAVLYPDTSPRGVPLPGDADTWDFGQSAGFYLDASAAPWSTHYKMESYLMDELLPLATSAFGLGKCGVSGHSMGGHGALTLALRHRGVFESVSAVAPICAPTECPWGRKAFEGYLGSVDAGKAHDACCLIRAAAGAHDGARKLPLLCDFGAADKFLTEQLKPAALKEACAAANWPLTLRYHAGSDHSYFFVASVFADHVAWHAQALGTAP